MIQKEVAHRTNGEKIQNLTTSFSVKRKRRSQVAIKKSGWVFCLVLLTLSAFSPLLGQRQTGVISGVITDDQGVPLPGAEVTINSPVLMGTRSFVSLADGSFRFPYVPPGVYKMT